MRLVRLADADAVSAAAAEELAGLLAAALGARGVAHLALTGGSSAAPVYERLAGLVGDWSAVHLWWGDERCVAPDDEQSNFLIARRALIEPAGIGADRVHRMRGELGPADGARAYAAELGEHVAARDERGLPVLDVVDLGLGPDGHVASLFPSHPLLAVDDATVAGVTDSPKPPPRRITLTLPVLRAARALVVHTAGASRAEAIARAAAGPDPAVPLSLLPTDRLTLIADEAAAGGLG
ncbi:MAG TPA: 6-phosphogluconolactonase [Solirubrobacteraceae bacterium]|nr:6-phosphogluconolactonase [Solirubrobacteraceae bacterium]